MANNCNNYIKVQGADLTDEQFGRIESSFGQGIVDTVRSGFSPADLGRFELAKQRKSAAEAEAARLEEERKATALEQRHLGSLTRSRFIGRGGSF